MKKASSGFPTTSAFVPVANSSPSTNGPENHIKHNGCFTMASGPSGILGSDRKQNTT